MALDASIIGGIKPLNLAQPDPIDRYVKLAGVQEITGKLADQERTRADEQAVREAYQQSGGDSATLRKLLTGRGAYKQIQALDKAEGERLLNQSTIARNTAQGAKATWEIDRDKLQIGAALLNEAKDAQSFETVLRVGETSGIFKPEVVAQWRAQGYSPQLVQSLQAAGITRAQQLTEQGNAATRAETGRHNVATETTARGQLGVAQGNLGETRRHHGVTEANEAVQYITTPTGIVAVPKRGTPGQAPTGQVVTDASGQALGGTANADIAQRKRDAQDVVGIVTQALPLLDKATNSYLGTAGSMVAQTFGASGEAGRADAQLKVLAGALVSKMPKMSGPQSDRDVQLYREMAGELGDSTKPRETRKAALRSLLELQRKYGVEIPPELEAQINPPQRTPRRGTPGANPRNLSDTELTRELDRKPP